MSNDAPRMPGLITRTLDTRIYAEGRPQSRKDPITGLTRGTLEILKDVYLHGPTSLSNITFRTNRRIQGVTLDSLEDAGLLTHTKHKGRRGPTNRFWSVTPKGKDIIVPHMERENDKTI